MKLYDYVKGYPACEGSPNASEAQPVLFKELDPIKDAQIEFDRRKRRNDAMNAAFALEGKDLDDMATLLGVFNDDPIFKINRISEFANQDPETFFRYYESGDRSVRALIRKAVILNKLKTVGEAIFWGKEVVGGNEDQAVAYLTTNQDKLAALNALVGFVPQENINGPKKAPNKPKEKV
jgi:hypothetical protein